MHTLVRLAGCVKRLIGVLPVFLTIYDASDGPATDHLRNLIKRNNLNESPLLISVIVAQANSATDSLFARFFEFARQKNLSLHRL